MEISYYTPQVEKIQVGVNCEKLYLSNWLSHQITERDVEFYNRYQSRIKRDLRIKSTGIQCCIEIKHNMVFSYWRDESLALRMEQIIKQEFPNIENLNITRIEGGDLILTFNEVGCTKEEVEKKLNEITQDSKYKPRHDVKGGYFRGRQDAEYLKSLFFSSDNFIEYALKEIKELAHSKNKEAILFDFAFTLRRIVISEEKERVGKILKQLN